MKELIITTAAIVGLQMAANPANPDSSWLELYYNDSITKKIVNCERIASMKNLKNSSMTSLVEMRSAQAKFYRKHRGKPVKEMVVRNLGKEPHKIDHFLTTKFKEST